MHRLNRIITNRSLRVVIVHRRNRLYMFLIILHVLLMILRMTPTLIIMRRLRVTIDLQLTICLVIHDILNTNLHILIITRPMFIRINRVCSISHDVIPTIHMFMVFF